MPGRLSGWGGATSSSPWVWPWLRWPEQRLLWTDMSEVPEEQIPEEQIDLKVQDVEISEPSPTTTREESPFDDPEMEPIAEQAHDREGGEEDG